MKVELEDAIVAIYKGVYARQDGYNDVQSVRIGVMYLLEGGIAEHIAKKHNLVSIAHDAMEDGARYGLTADRYDDD